MNRHTNLKTNQAAAYFGGIPKMAEILRVSRHAIYQWGDYVPELRAYQIEVITNGKLTASSEDSEADAEETERAAA